MLRDPKFRKILRCAIFFVILACLVACIRKGANFLLGWGLITGFSRGTDCIVTLTDPRVSFFPIRGQVHNVHIRHPTEAPDHGFFSKRVSVEVSLAKIFSKRIGLRSLLLEESHVLSFGKNTGFVNTIDFVAGESSPSNKEKKWHSFLSTGWKVSLRDVTIQTVKAEGPQLVVETNGYHFLWDDVVFLGVNDPTPKTPLIVTASSSEFLFHVGQSRPIPFGPLEVEGTIGGDLIQVQRASLRDHQTVASQKTLITIQGNVYLDAPEAYQLSVSGELFSPYLKRIFGSSLPLLPDAPLGAHLEATVGGGLEDPNAAGKLSLSFDEPLPFFKRQACALKQAATDFTVDGQRLELSNIKLDDIADEMSFHVSFKDELAFSTTATLSLNAEKEAVSRCLSGEPSEGLPLIHSVADSKNHIELEGTFRPLAFQGVLTSELQLSRDATRSRFTANVQLKDKVLSGLLQERGSIPQIVAASENSSDQDASTVQTAFKTVPHSQLDAQLSYNFVDNLLALERLQMKQYPATRIVARLAPFLSEDQFTWLSKSIAGDSLVDTSLTLTFSPEHRGGKGMLSISPIELPVLSKGKLELQVSGSNNQLQISPITFDTAAGKVEGAITLDTERRLVGHLDAPEILLPKLRYWEGFVPNLNGTMNASLQLNAQLGSPTPSMSYSGKINVLTQNETLPEVTGHSEFVLDGDEKKLQLNGRLFDGRVIANLQYPFVDQDELSLQVAVSELPLDFLLASKKDFPQSDSPLHGVLSAKLDYKGPLETPLLGEGQLEVPHFELNSGESRIYHQVPLQARISKGRLQFVDVTLLANNQPLIIKGFVDQALGWNTQIDGVWALNALLAGFTSIEQSTGTLQTSLQVVGPVETPELNGSLRLSDASLSFALPSSVVELRQLEANLTLSDNMARLENLTARAGDGFITGHGTIAKPLNAQERQIALRLAFDDVFVEPIRNLSLTFGGKLALDKASLSRPSLQGDFFISNALYEDTIELKQIISSLTKRITGIQAVYTEPSSGFGQSEGNFDMDLQIRAGRALLIDTNFLRAEMKGDLRVSGTPKTPRVTGKFEALEGTFAFGSSSFEIIHGKLTFPDRVSVVDPTLDIIGETTVKTQRREDYQVQLRIDGTLTKPILTLSSNSGMSEREILSLLSFGQKVGQVSLLGHGTRVHALSYRELLSPVSSHTLQERVNSLTGFSEVTLDARSSVETGEFIPTITARKPLTDELDVVLETELAAEEDSSATVEYSLTPYLSLLSGWRSRPETQPDSSSGSLNFGVRYKKSFPGAGLIPPVFPFE